MHRSLAEIAQLVRGSVYIPDHLQGQLDPNQCEIAGTATLRNARPGFLTFAKGDSAWKLCNQTTASAAIVSSARADASMPCIIVEDPESAFAEITQLFRPTLKRNSVGISPSAHVSPLAQLGDGVVVYPNAFIGDHVVIGDNTTIMPGVCIMEHCRIGNDVVLFANVVLYENTIVGDRCILHAGVVLGAYGFGYRNEDGRHQLSSQMGNVQIGDDVEIGANSTIDRGTFDSTTVGNGTKIDNQVMIGHNCQIGSHNLLCSQVGIAGSCTTGDYVVMAGQVGIGDHLDIGDRVILGAKAGVMHSIPSNQHFLGIPATPIREQMQIFATIQKLPDLRKQIKGLQRMVEQMEAERAATIPESSSIPIQSSVPANKAA